MPDLANATKREFVEPVELMRARKFTNELGVTINKITDELATPIEKPSARNPPRKAISKGPSRDYRDFEQDKTIDFADSRDLPPRTQHHYREDLEH